MDKGGGAIVFTHREQAGSEESAGVETTPEVYIKTDFEGESCVGR